MSGEVLSSSSAKEQERNEESHFVLEASLFPPSASSSGSTAGSDGPRDYSAYVSPLSNLRGSAGTAARARGMSSSIVVG